MSCATGHPGPLALWVQILWQAMEKSGEGYRKHSLTHTGNGIDRRNDKLREVAGANSGGKPTIALIPFNPPETKLQRKARLGKLGVSA